MNDIYKIVVRARQEESLADLCLQIENSFPNIDEQVESFTTSEGTKALFASGKPIIEEIEIVLTLSEPTQDDLYLADNLIKLIKELEMGEIEIFLKEKQV